MRPSPIRRLLGVDFFVGPLDTAASWVVAGGGAADERTPSGYGAGGGLIVAPSAPGLAVDLVTSPAYREALTSASLVMTDSGFMVLLWWLQTGERLPRHSGLKLMRALLARDEFKRPGAVFWVMPSREDDARNRAWLSAQGHPVTSEDVYVAPHYAPGTVVDEELVAKIEVRRPRIVMLAIGGGVQERVGMMLRNRLSGSPSIVCLGAAIGFLTGTQADIPEWADRLLLGGMLRLARNPRRFWRRFWNALGLAPLLWHYADRLPPLRKP